MTANNILKKQIIIEIIALLVLIGVIFYAIFAIQKSNTNKIQSTNGFVTVLDDKDFKGLDIYSDAEALEQEGITYTVTNNNKDKKTFKIVIKPSIDNKDVLKHIKISVNDLYVSNLTDLEKENDNYIISTQELKSGYTKNNLIKLWYDLDSPKTITQNKISFKYDIVVQ